MARTIESIQEKDASARQDDEKIERIYIGGMDPDRLTIQEVLDRIPTDAIRIESISHPDVNPFYCHVSAVLKKESSSSSSSSSSPTCALEVVQKLLGNVKWKGCKLQVQAARPHFLERLEAERRAVQEQAKSSTTLNATTDTSNSNNRRYYRVRQSYGKPAWLVDTKPYEVEDAKIFGKMVQHVRRRHDVVHKNQNEGNHEKLSSKKPYRAVHWRFDSTGTIEAKSKKDVVGEDSSSLASLEYSSSSSSTKSSESNGAPQEHYVWSDDESTSEESSASDSVSASNLPQKTTADEKQSPAHESGSGSSSEEDESGSLPKSKDLLGGANDKTSNTYAWSDDDDDSSASDDDSTERRRSRPFAPNDNSYDEFAAAIDNEENEEAGKAFKSDNQEETQSNNINMEDDEARNLKILAALYPDTMDKPSSANKVSTADKVQDGWNASGQIMMRYDPTKESSKDLEQTTVEDVAKDDSSEDGSHSSQSKETEDDQAESEDEMKVDEEKEASRKSKEESSNIYRQGDLETVFRQARESQAKRAPVVIEKESDSVPKDGGFSFGFVVEEQPQVSNESTTTFSFGFDVSNNQAETEETPAIPEPEEEHDEEDAEKTRRKRRLLNSSYDDLDVYVNAYFFELNEGKRLAQDLNGFRQDPAVQEDWERERQRLTSDWKGKRKYAVARKQKQRHY